MAAEESHQLDIDGRLVPLRLRRRRGVKKLTLRVDPENDGAVVTAPPRLPAAEVLDFVQRQSGWIRARLDRLPRRVSFEDGAEVPILGEPHRIRHVPEARRGVWRENGEIRVSGQPEHLPRRLGDWFRKEARREISARVAEKASMLGRRAGRISIRDTRSRWGSCTARGDLNFSWRLVMAPEMVLDYVVAHEVAHLEHLDHSVRFWRTVDRLTEHTAAAKAWLKRHGGALHRVG